jgi:uncharacterized protein (TIGR03437 family)
MAVFLFSPTVAPTQFEVLVDAGVNNTQPPDWLLVRPRRATTPARIRLEVTRTNLPAGVHRARLLPRLLVGSQTIPLPEVNIQLRVESKAPELAIAPQAVRLTARAGTSNPEMFVVRVGNRGSGGLNCQAVTATADEPWIRVNVDSLPGCRVTIRTQSETLAPGPYRGSVTIQTPIGTQVVPVGLQVFQPAPRILLFPLGLQFESRQGNDSPQVRNLSVLNSGEADMPYRVSIVDQTEGQWIRLFNPQGQAARGEAGTVGVGVDPRGLAPGAYHALLRVVADGAANSPMFSSVVLNVAPATTDPIAAPSPSGLIFNVEAHTGTSAAQVVTVFTSSDTPVPFQASAQALDTTVNWLNIAPVSGSTSTGNPARLSVTVNPLGLNAGTFEGQVNTVVLVPNGELEVRTVNVTLVVRPQGVVVTAAAQPAKGPPSLRLVDCSPTKLSLTHTGLVSNFLTRAGWPTPLNVRLVDDCGQNVTDGSVVVNFSNGDAPLALVHIRAGNYSGTWTPRNPSDAPVSVRTDAQTRGMSATFDLVGSVAVLSSPVVTADGILNTFNPVRGAPLSPGMIVEIYGTALAGGTATPTLEGGKVPIDVNNVSVIIGGLRAPLFFLSPDQINALIPYELAAGDQQLLLVRSNRAYSVPTIVSLASRQPGLLARNGAVQAVDGGGQLITSANPARRGGVAILFMVGLGPTNPPVASADPAPANPLARLVETPRVTVGGRPVDLLFAGLAPGFAGLYQLNVQLPADLATGDQELVVTQGGVESNRATLPVR